MKDLIFAVPTYRYNEAHICAQVYARNFQKYRHHVPIVVFDDSAPPHSITLEQNLKKVANEFPNQAFYYFGFSEKQSHLERIASVFPRDILSNLLRPSCGGNHNWIFLYTLGKFQLTVDEDITPVGLTIPPRSSAKDDSLAYSGKFYKKKPRGAQETEFDIIRAYEAFLGKTSGDILRDHPGILAGKHLNDSLVNLEFNITTSSLTSNTVHTVQGSIDPTSRVYVVQSYLTGDVDLDSKDIVAEFLKEGDPEVLKGFVPKKYYIDRFKPCLLDFDYKATGALLGLDNRNGFMFFIPTHLRIDDFLFRLYTQKEGVDVAYCNAIQTHNRLMSRRVLLNDFFHEEMSFVLKKALMENFTIKGLVTNIPPKYEFHIDDVMKVAQEVDNLRVKTRNRSGNVFDAFRRDVAALGVDEKKKFLARIRMILEQEYKIAYESTTIWEDLVNFASEHPLRARRITA